MQCHCSNVDFLRLLSKNSPEPQSFTNLLDIVAKVSENMYIFRDQIEKDVSSTMIKRFSRRRLKRTNIPLWKILPPAGSTGWLTVLSVGRVPLLVWCTRVSCPDKLNLEKSHIGADKTSRFHIFFHYDMVPIQYVLFLLRKTLFSRQTNLSWIFFFILNSFPCFSCLN